MEEISVFVKIDLPKNNPVVLLCGHFGKKMRQNISTLPFGRSVRPGEEARKSHQREVFQIGGKPLTEFILTGILEKVMLWNLETPSALPRNVFRVEASHQENILRIEFFFSRIFQ